MMQLPENITTVLFDMDGLLIDSEPIWQKAEIEVFQEVNITLTKERCMETMGMRLDEVISYWYDQYPWDAPSKSDIQKRITERVIHYVYQEGQALPGAVAAVKNSKAKGLLVAVASSSYYAIIHAVLDKLEITDCFDLVYSAEEEAYGKPHPGIFISAAEKLNASPAQCLVFEDSLTGILAGKAAKMQVAAVPDQLDFNDPRLSIADYKLLSLEEFSVGSDL